MIENSNLEKFGSMDVKINPDFCSMGHTLKIMYVCILKIYSNPKKDYENQNSAPRLLFLEDKAI